MPHTGGSRKSALRFVVGCLGLSACVFGHAACAADKPEAPPSGTLPLDGRAEGQRSSGMGAGTGVVGSRAAALLRDAAAEPVAAPDDLELVIALVAEWRSLKPESIKASQTFTQLGCDDIDLTEILIEIEKRLKIQVPDDAIEAAVVRAKIPGGLRFTPAALDLTLAQFAAVITATRRP